MTLSNAGVRLNFETVRNKDGGITTVWAGHDWSGATLTASLFAQGSVTPLLSMGVAIDTGTVACTLTAAQTVTLTADLYYWALVDSVLGVIFSGQVRPVDLPTGGHAAPVREQAIVWSDGTTVTVQATFPTITIGAVADTIADASDASTGAALGDDAFIGGGLNVRDFDGTLTQPTALIVPDTFAAGDYFRTQWLNLEPIDPAGAIVGVELTVAVAAGLSNAFVLVRATNADGPVNASVAVLSGGSGFGPANGFFLKADDAASSQRLRLAFPAGTAAGVSAIQVAALAQGDNTGATVPHIAVSDVEWLSADSSALAALASTTGSDVNLTLNGLLVGIENDQDLADNLEGRLDNRRFCERLVGPLDPEVFATLTGGPVDDGDQPFDILGGRCQKGDRIGLLSTGSGDNGGAWHLRIDSSSGQWIVVTDDEATTDAQTFTTNALVGGCILICSYGRADFVSKNSDRIVNRQDPLLAGPSDDGEWQVNLSMPQLPDDPADGTSLQIIGGVPQWVAP